MNYTKEQFKIINAKQGAFLVTAAPGSGKTACVTERIAQLITDGIPSWQILAVTFTNKAAKEMSDRVTKKAGEHEATICTFHSLGYKAFVKFKEELGYKNFEIVPQKYIKNVAISIFNNKYSTDRQTLNDINKFISNLSYFKKEQKEPEIFLQSFWKDIYIELEEIMLENQKITFDDLIYKINKLFENNKTLLEKFRRKYKYIIVDESQDTNKAQFQLLYNINHTNNLMVVGDPSQAIYRFQGANINNIFNYEKLFNPKILYLSKNFRSTKKIVNTVNKIMDFSLYEDKFKSLIQTDNAEGIKPELILYNNEKEQASMIADKIQELIIDGYEYHDISILYRMNSNSFELEREFIKREMPFTVKSGSFLNAKEIQFILACLKIDKKEFEDEKMTNYTTICNNFKNDISEKTMQLIFTFDKNKTFEEIILSGIKIKGIGPKRKEALNKFMDFLNKIKPVIPKKYEHYKDKNYLNKLKHYICEIITENVQNEEEYERRLENLNLFIDIFYEYFNSNKKNKTLKNFINDFTVRFTIDDTDEDNKEENSIILSTIHSYKGLERPIIFVINIRDGIFPMFPNTVNDAEYMDNINLLYVACSRAKELMYISAPRFTNNNLCKTESYSLLNIFNNTNLLKNYNIYNNDIMKNKTGFFTNYKLL